LIFFSPGCQKPPSFHLSLLESSLVRKRSTITGDAIGGFVIGPRFLLSLSGSRHVFLSPLPCFPCRFLKRFFRSLFSARSGQFFQYPWPPRDNITPPHPILFFFTSPSTFMGIIPPTSFVLISVTKAPVPYPPLPCCCPSFTSPRPPAYAPFPTSPPADYTKTSPPPPLTNRTELFHSVAILSARRRQHFLFPPLDFEQNTSAPPFPCQKKNPY